MERKLESDFLSRRSLKFSKPQLSLSLAMWSECISLWGECNEETNKIFGPGFPQSCQSLSQQSIFKEIWPTCGVLSKVLKESANQYISKVNGATCPVWSFPPSFSWPFIQVTPKVPHSYTHHTCLSFPLLGSSLFVFISFIFCSTLSFKPILKWFLSILLDSPDSPS